MKKISAYIALILFFAAVPAHAKDITIIYSGETHAMLYPCSCPLEPDGGIARRATLLKQLRKNNPDALVLDSGGFFAGGLLDEYTQNTQLDSARSAVNLKAMDLMQYDAAGIGDDEFNFGRQFLKANLDGTKLNFLSCNLAGTDFSANIKPYYIKDVSGIRIGVIGVTPLSAVPKAEGLKFSDPKQAVEKAVGELKQKGAKIIVLLSRLIENEETTILNDIPGIDVAISAHNYSQEGAFKKQGNTLVLRPTWQGRRLDKVTLTFADNRIADYKVENLRLSDKIADDPVVRSMLPACFSDNNCKQAGKIGTCNNPGSTKAACSFNEASKINLLIITSKTCITCMTEGTVNNLKREFPGLVVSYSYYPESKAANKLIKDYNITGLPVYLLGQEIEKDKKFDRLKTMLDKKDDFYMMKPEAGGFSYFINRKKIKGQLDLFISLYDKNTKQLLDVIREFNPTVHFLVIVGKDGKFDAATGEQEVEESLRSVCVQKYYPEYSWNYLNCRAKDINSSWWDNCLGNNDAQKIKVCARGEEGKALLGANISLGRELEVMFGPTYLMDNQEIFTSNGVPTREELKTILRR